MIKILCFFSLIGALIATGLSVAEIIEKDEEKVNIVYYFVSRLDDEYKDVCKDKECYIIIDIVADFMSHAIIAVYSFCFYCLAKDYIVSKVYLIIKIFKILTLLFIITVLIKAGGIYYQYKTKRDQIGNIFIYLAICEGIIVLTQILFVTICFCLSKSYNRSLIRFHGFLATFRQTPRSRNLRKYKPDYDYIAEE